MYGAQIRRNNPTCFVFLIDQSGSMDEALPEGIAKSHGVADATNKILSNLVIKCTKDEELPRDYFHVGVIGYGGGVQSAFTGALAVRELVPISEIAVNPGRVEQRTKKIPDGAGGLIEQQVPFAVWFDPIANGGTPMCAALSTAQRLVADFLAQHPDCFPPIIINITDGAATDGDPLIPAQAVTEHASSDGTVLLFNLHLSSMSGTPVEYPSSPGGLTDPYASKLFEMSSVLPDKMLSLAQQSGYEVSPGARGFAFNANFESLVKFLEIGTVVADR